LKILGVIHVIFLMACFWNAGAIAQQITGVWEGKINRKKVELKIIQKGDSLTGTSYYFESGRNYRRYSIKGYFNSKENAVVWWDDHLIEEKSSGGLFGSIKQGALLSNADFSCPGGDKLWLNGTCAPKDDQSRAGGTVDLQKSGGPYFSDEWDFIIENYTAGANDPYLIDSVNAIAGAEPVGNPARLPENPTPEQPLQSVIAPVEKPLVRNIPATKIKAPPTPGPMTIEEKMVSRKKIISTEIPLAGDSIELRFYDNAEIDGDSISLFLNQHLIFEHIRLSDTAYTVKLAVHDLKDDNELIMVAENLGSIPPNTSFMVAIVDNKRYEARLESTEQTSAVIRFLPPGSKPTPPR
jgi:hypothetical protein